ncbi:phosphoribosylaminoimidazolecarboxamide formyltransferase [Arcanobacterium phocae]|uniref:phosphoribosylaminoimidazolecarboxamide formyltransferase n=1 Tax=Arcanobacterium phocae TaxID=131112 RepID=UPI001C10E344|nr:phosphoribosylaminoimidazolecarboxamide formyltransferase [Arcanobacterium phocae]
MNRLELKYGNNPHQKPAHIAMKDGQELPLRVLNGKAGYINLLDALNGWQLVRELKVATGLPAATSFKHVSPTSAAVGQPLSETLKKVCFVDDVDGLDESPLACAYVRARGTDRMCSFGDFVALSDVCDVVTARCIKREVSDGVIAPGYEPEALEILSSKRNGNYTVIEIDPDYEPAPLETKDVFGITFSQHRNNLTVDESLLANVVTTNKDLPAANRIDLLIGIITLKYTQSNSVCYAYQGQAIGVGAGQQSRIHCTRLAGDKADTWFLRQHPKVLGLQFKPDLGRATRDNVIDSYINHNEEDVCAVGIWENYFVTRPQPLTETEKREFLAAQSGVSLASDAFFPFSDNIKRAVRSGVSYVVQPGGSIRDDEVIDSCNDHNIVMVCNGVRFFHH